MGWGLCSWTLFICEKGNDPKWGLLRFSANITVLFSWNFYFFCFVLFCLDKAVIYSWPCTLLFRAWDGGNMNSAMENMFISIMRSEEREIKYWLWAKLYPCDNSAECWFKLGLFTSVGDPFKFVLVLCFQGLNGCIIRSWQKGSEINRDWKLVHLMSTWKNTDCIFSVVWKGN